MKLLEFLKVIFLGIIEGITEWLPISSTGHMLLVDEFLQLSASDEFKEMFFVVIQLGAILAVVLLFWKKMWPFSLFWPQVDYERIVRLMSEIRKNAINQNNLVLQAKSKAKPFEKTFLDAVPAYLEALDVSCQKLSAAAQWKQDMLLRRINKDVKLRRDVAEWSQILKEYEDAQGNLVRAGAFVQVGWGVVQQAHASQAR